MDYKTLSDTQLKKIMVDYINRVIQLRTLISKYLNHTINGKLYSETIKSEYRTLKEELKAIADYTYLNKNQNGSDLYDGLFAPSVQGTIAYGFQAKTNSAINGSMFSSVSEAYYRLTKYCSLEEWESTTHKK